MASITNDVQAGINQSRSFVAERFNLAEDYSTNAWNTAISYLNQLSALVVNLVMPEDTVEYVTQSVDISSDVRSTRPEAPSTGEMVMSLPSMPQMDTLEVFPAIEFPVSLINQNSNELFTQLLAKLKAGGTGLGADVEQDIWDRMRSRAELENAQKYTEVEDYFSSRGFNLPVGAMAGRLNEIVVEIARNDSYLNNDIAVEQARLAQTNTQFILQTVASTISDYTKTAVTKVVSNNQNLIGKYVAQLDGYKTSLQKEVSRVENALKRFSAQVQEYGVDGTISTAEIDAKIKQAGLMVEQAKIQADILMKEAEMEIEKAKMKYGLQIEAIKAGGSIAAQIAASSLSSVSATAQYGFHAQAGESYGASDSYSHQYSEAKNINISG